MQTKFTSQEYKCSAVQGYAEGIFTKNINTAKMYCKQNDLHASLSKYSNLTNLWH